MSRRTLCLDDRLYDYLLAASLREAPPLRRLREETGHLSVAEMQIAPEQGQFMALMVRLLGGRRTLDIGVFTGYSALSVALALPPDGQVVACDINPEWTSIARRYWAEAGVADRIDLRLAPAARTLAELLAAEGENGFDFAFIDADKSSYDTYYESCLRLVRPGGLIAIDNTLWGGSVADPTMRDEDTEAIRALNAKIRYDGRVDISLLPIADGLTLARRLRPESCPRVPRRLQLAARR